MRRTLIAALVLGLVAGALTAPATAKKKKRPKAPVATPMTLWFHAAECSDAAYLLMLTEAAEGRNCGSAFYGAPYPVASAAGQSAPRTFNAAEGLPFTLDASQKIVATVYVSPYVSGQGAGSGVGQTTLIATFAGTTGGETKELGTVEQSYTVTPAQAVYEVKVELEPPAELDKAQFTGFSITLHNEGTSLTHGFYRMTNPASSIVIPTWK
ncbi:MAG: hypothetical protein ABR613_06455 [Actinomycetota bacterium]